MENGATSDAQISASSQWDNYHGPRRARLNGKRSAGNGVGAWCAITNDIYQWLQVDLRKYTTVTRIATQGRSDLNQWVTKYRLQYSEDGVNFHFYKALGQDSAMVRPVNMLLASFYVIRIPEFGKFLRNPWSGKTVILVESGILLMKLKESENFANDWNPESKTVLDHFTWGDCFSTSGGSRGRVQGVRTSHIRPDACLRLKFLHWQDRISLFNWLIFSMKGVLHFATKLNYSNIKRCTCFWVPSYDLFASARKAAFPAPMATGVHKLRSTWSSLLSQMVDNYSDNSADNLILSSSQSSTVLFELKFGPRQ